MFARLVIAAILVASSQAKDSDDLRPLLAAKEANARADKNALRGERTPQQAALAQPEPAPSEGTQSQPQAESDDSDIDADIDDDKPQQDEAPVAAPRKVGATKQPHQSFGKQTAKVSDPVMNGLKVELASLKRNKINVEQLQRTEGASKALLREGEEMMRGATSRHSREAYGRQVHESETVEKEAVGLMQDGRVAAAEDARAALREAAVVQKVAQALAAEASTQLRQYAKVVEPTKQALGASTSDDADDDDLDMD